MLSPYDTIDLLAALGCYLELDGRRYQIVDIMQDTEALVLRAAPGDLSIQTDCHGLPSRRGRALITMPLRTPSGNIDAQITAGADTKLAEILAQFQSKKKLRTS